MAEVPKRRTLKTGFRVGGGPPPGYAWGSLFFDEAEKEASGLNKAQYAHILQQIRELGHEDDPSHPQTIDVDAIEDFHEMRDKGGVLGKINFRVYFYLDHANRVIVILGADKKEEDGQTSAHVKAKMRNRLRRYRTEFAQSLFLRRRVIAKRSK